MNVTQLPINDLKLVDTLSHRDSRGSFSRFFCAEELSAVLEYRKIVQINHSKTTRVGAIRGMHFQYPPYAEMKLVRCLSGRVLDVIVDLRSESTTFLQWYAQELSSDNALMIVIPEGCAHGYQVLKENSEMLYLHTEYYHPESGGRIRFDDPKINIEWPLVVTDISEADMSENFLPEDYQGVAI